MKKAEKDAADAEEQEQIKKNVEDTDTGLDDKEMSDMYEDIIKDLHSIDDYAQYLSKLKNYCQDSEYRKVLAWGIKNGKFANDGGTPKEETVPVSELYPTQDLIGLENSVDYPIQHPEAVQNDFSNPVKIGTIYTIEINGKKYVLDGHHRWSQVCAYNPSANLVVMMLPNQFAKSPQGALENL